MANAFNLDIEHVATTASLFVGKDMNLAGLISTDVAAHFERGHGATVRIRVPSAIPTRSKPIYDKTTALVADELSEQYIDVTLSEHLYNLVVLSEGDLSLSIGDFAAQVLKPQTRAIAAKIEAMVAATLSATPLATGIAYAAATPAKAFTAARQRLRDNGVADGATMRAAVGSSVWADFLDAAPGSGFDASSTESRRTVRGIEVFESTRLDSKAVVAFVPEAFSLVVRAPEVPRGASNGASLSTPGDATKGIRPFAVRSVVDYDSSIAADRSLISTFAAVQAMPLAVDKENGTVDLLAHGGAVRFAKA